MPFKSLAQERWAFATHQKFAKKWADMTNQKNLPYKVGKKKTTKKKKYDGRTWAMRRLGLKKSML